MTAETILPLVQSLSEEEQLRLISMLNIKDKKKISAQKEVKGWSEKEIRKILGETIFKLKKCQ